MTQIVKISVVSGLIFLTALALFLTISTTHANPSTFQRANNIPCNTYTASTSPTFMTPGKATTTISYDTGCGSVTGADSIVLALQLLGSTTPANAAVATSTFNVSFEYSQDNIDWYEDAAGTVATTTQLGWETINGTLVASTTPTKLIVVPKSPSRYIRAVIGVSPGSLNGAAWGEFIGKKQNP